MARHPAGHLFFGNSNASPGRLSNISPEVANTTTLSTSHGMSKSSEAWLRHQHQHGQAESGYWLLDPAEVQRLPVTRLDYRRDGRWRGQWDAWRGQAL